ncbi:PEBP-like protein [Amylostereum chailletii]|nr:PEBP-like protein [Amylostereum chailletii]
MSLDPLASITTALTREHLIPDVLPPTFQPTLLFSVLYPTGSEVLLGNELTPQQTVDEPSIVLAPLNIPSAQADSAADDPARDTSYTLVLLDPDTPTRAAPIYRSFRHWVITGLKAPSEGLPSTTKLTALSTRPATTPYRPPGPRPASGIHRYTFLLFQEPHAEPPLHIPEDTVEYGAALEERRSWNALEFGERYGLKLVGVNFFLVRAE